MEVLKTFYTLPSRILHKSMDMSLYNSPYCLLLLINYIPFDSLSSKVRVKAKLRYRHVADDAWLIPLGEDGAVLEFDRPQRAPTPGQAAVFYDGDIVIGGGIII